MAVKPIPEGYHTVTPYLVARDAAKVLEFARQAFGAQVVEEMRRPDGSIWHAEFAIGDSRIMVGQASEQHQAMPSTLYVYVPDTDGTYKRALGAGGVSTMEPADQFYGDRNAGVRDPAGNIWFIGTHIEDVSAAEMHRRAQEAMRQRSQA